jgi:hypothetical protein
MDKKKRTTSSKAKLAGVDKEEATEQIAEHPTVEATLAKKKSPRTKKPSEEPVEGIDGQSKDGQDSRLDKKSKKGDQESSLSFIAANNSVKDGKTEKSKSKSAKGKDEDSLLKEDQASMMSKGDSMVQFTQNTT